ncbi:MAG TPA: transposase, partial [Hyphomicrobiaceae bacterium]|nr:transposase [Hyphomicrobiaceae bacterium]
MLLDKPLASPADIQQRVGRRLSRTQGSPMQTECSADLFGFAPVEGRKVVVGFDGGRFAGCFTGHRTTELVGHTVPSLVGQRVFGIALGYEDLIDHDQLRHDQAANNSRVGCHPTRSFAILSAMKIATFNVNGVNGRLPVLLRWLDEARPDIACLQELKAS